MKKIAIAVDRQEPKDFVFIYKQDYVNEAYISAIEKAGGIPLLLPFTKDLSIIDEMLNGIDGLVLTGGNDISPILYGENERGSKNTDRVLDDFHIALIAKSIEKEIPILGICRGFQILNVALGGTLYQDIASEKENAINHKRTDLPYSPVHDVNVVEDSFLSRIFKKDALGVNSLHHQGIKSLSKKLRPAAYAPDGLIEAFEGDKICAVQWHPEAMGERMSQIFSFFVKDIC